MTARNASRRRAIGALGALGTIAASIPATADTSETANGPALATTPRLATARPFSFGLIGDTPYNWLDQQALKRVMAAMAAEPLAFVLHVGDIKSSGEACSDTLLSDRLAMLDASAHPLVLTPGDNEWTDCWRSAGASGDRDWPLERLAWLRRQAFALPRSLGRRTLAVEQQTGGRETHAPEIRGLPENLRWAIGGLRFCTLHVVGSNNGGRQTPALEAAWQARQRANADWLKQTVALALAEGAAGLVIAMHANLRFERQRRDGWATMRALVVAAARRFGGPVLLLHGDTHWFREGTLLPDEPDLANLYRVECFGSPFSSSWVSIRWNPAALAVAPQASRGAIPDSPPPQQAGLPDIQALPFVVGTRQV